MDLIIYVYNGGTRRYLITCVYHRSTKMKGIIWTFDAVSEYKSYLICISHRLYNIELGIILTNTYLNTMLTI